MTKTALTAFNPFLTGNMPVFYRSIMNIIHDILRPPKRFPLRPQSLLLCTCQSSHLPTIKITHYTAITLLHITHYTSHNKQHTLHITQQILYDTAWKHWRSGMHSSTKKSNFGAPTFYLFVFACFVPSCKILANSYLKFVHFFTYCDLSVPQYFCRK